MSDNQKTQHEQLIAARWRYDATQDRYASPGSATDGTEQWYNLAAAWQAMQLNAASEATGQTPPRGMRKVDPRQQEPE